MAERKAFLLRLPKPLYDDLNLWAKDDLRSLNAQIEFLLREVVQKRKGNKSSRPPEKESR